MKADSKHLLTHDDITVMPEQVVQHQFNDNAIRHTRTLSTPTGLSRIGIHLVRIESGRDSTTYHYHDADEEFIYIVAGRGIARIGEGYSRPPSYTGASCSRSLRYRTFAASRPGGVF